MNASFLRFVGQLKSTLRTGWTRYHGVNPRVESVADHSWRMAVMCLCSASALREAGIDRDRCIRISLVHDLAEAVCGDIVLLDDVGDREAVSAQLLSIDSKDEKHRIERAALESILAQLGESPDAQEIREEVLSLWLEYEEQSTAEARFVKECDKLEMALQAHEYMGRGSDPLDEFLASVRGKVQSPHMRSIQEEIDPASKP